MGERLEDLMKSVLEDIKTQEYKQAYLFFGEEGYLKKQYRNKLLQAWNPDGDTMNESRFEGKGIDVKEVISLGETMPFFLIDGSFCWRIPDFSKISARNWQNI